VGEIIIFTYLTTPMKTNLITFIEEISVSGFETLPPFLIFSSKGDGSGLQLNISPDNAD